MQLRRARGATLIWQDKGSKNHEDLHFYRPLLRDDEISLGHYASNTPYNPNRQWMVAVVPVDHRNDYILEKEIHATGAFGESLLFDENPFFAGEGEIVMTPVIDEDMSNGMNMDSMPPYARPVSFTQVWNDEGSGSVEDVQIFRPCAPPGYESIGDVVINCADLNTYGGMLMHIPFIKDICCVRADLLTRAVLGELLWEDSTCGGVLGSSCVPVSFWPVKANNSSPEELTDFGFTLGLFVTSTSRDMAGIMAIPRVLSYAKASLSTCIVIQPVVFENQR